MSVFNELNRRNVIRVGIAYVVTAWLILQVVVTIQEILPVPQWVSQGVLLLLVIGLPITLVLAWVFELSPDGLKLDSEVDQSLSSRQVNRKRLDRVIIGVLLVAIVYIAYDKLVVDRAADREALRATSGSSANIESDWPDEDAAAQLDKSIAVLPFVNMSSDPDQAYFSDGISEELLNLLARIEDLRVAARTSSFSLRDQQLEVTEIGERLNVAYVLEGSVRKAGNQVRITAQLIRADNGYHLWSETYDRTLDNIFAVQDEISAAVVDQLKVTILGAAPTVEVTDPEAYSLVLQARHLVHLGSVEALAQAVIFLEQALAIDPQFGAAWAELALIHARAKTPETQPAAVEAANRALAIDSRNARAHAALGLSTMMSGQDLAGAASHVARALELAPEDPYVLWVGSGISMLLGRLIDFHAISRKIVSIDPLNSNAHYHLGLAWYLGGQPNEAIESGRNALRLSPGRVLAHTLIGKAYLQKGDPEAALAEMEQASLEVARLMGVSMAQHALGNSEKSDAALIELIEKYETTYPLGVANVMAFRGDNDGAFEWLAKATQYGQVLLGEIVVSPEFRELRRDPRWQPFLESIGMSAARLDKIEFKVDLPE